MSTTIHAGHTRPQTVLGTDGSVPASLAAVSSDNTVCTVAVSGNTVTLTGVVSGPATITYSAPGYLDATDTVTVLPRPGLVVTDGAET